MGTRGKGRDYRNATRKTREINQVDLELLKFSPKIREIAMDGATYISHKLIRYRLRV
jgi:hypothetical protein